MSREGICSGAWGISLSGAPMPLEKAPRRLSVDPMTTHAVSACAEGAVATRPRAY